MTGLWNPEAETDACGLAVAPFPSSSNDAYYGIDGGVCDYNTGAHTTGELAMTFDINMGASASMSFWSFEETECGGGNCGWDERYVDVSTDGGASWIPVWGSAGPEGGWYLGGANLAPFANGPLRARFRFDSIDGAGNDYFGWMVDDVVIETEACEPLPGAVLEPERIQVEGCPCTEQEHKLTFLNHTGLDDEVLVDYTTSPGATVVDVPATLGVIPDGRARPFNAVVKIDSGLLPSTTVTVTVTAYLASNPLISDTTVIEKHAVLFDSSWQSEPDDSFHTPFYRAAGATLGNYAYVIGGQDGTALTDTTRFRPSTG
jgi:hypothetical protein